MQLHTHRKPARVLLSETLPETLLAVGDGFEAFQKKYSEKKATVPIPIQSYLLTRLLVRLRLLEKLFVKLAFLLKKILPHFYKRAWLN